LLSKMITGSSVTHESQYTAVVVELLL